MGYKGAPVPDKQVQAAPAVQKASTNHAKAVISEQKTPLHSTVQTVARHSSSKSSPAPTPPSLRAKGDVQQSASQGAKTTTATPVSNRSRMVLLQSSPPKRTMIW